VGEVGGGRAKEEGGGHSEDATCRWI
jgi:hypothetical protein